MAILVAGLQTKSQMHIFLELLSSKLFNSLVRLLCSPKPAVTYVVQSHWPDVCTCIYFHSHVYIEVLGRVFLPLPTFV